MVRIPGRVLTAALAAAVWAASPAAAQEMQGPAGELPEVLWAIPVGEIDREEDEIDGTSVDPQGNTIIAGVFYDRVRLDGRVYESRGAGDIFLASIAPDGTFRWVRQFGGRADDNAYDVTTDGAGNILMSGWFSDTVDFGGATLEARGGTDMFVAKYDSAGELTWARGYGGPEGDGGNEISVLPSGEIAVSAITAGDMDFGGRQHRFGGGRRDSLAVRMSPDGDVLWATPFDGPGTERIRAIEIAPSGDVYVGFQYRGQLRAGDHSLEAAGDWDGALVRLRPDGSAAWAKPVGSASGVDNVRGVGVSPEGDIYASGVISGQPVLLDRQLPNVGRGVDYVVRVTPDGGIVWVLGLVGRGASFGAELVADSRGVVLSGLLTGEVQVRLGRERLGTFRPTTDAASAYLAAFAPDGRPRFFYTPTPKGQGARANGAVLALSPDGRYLAHSIRFRGTVSVAGHELSGPSKKDSAIVLFDLKGN